MSGNAYLRGVDALGARHARAYDDEAVDEAGAVAAQAIAEVEAVGYDASPDGAQPLALPMLAPPRPARVLRSELDGVSDAEWTEFVLAMKTQDPGAISASNELGMFALKARRLADLGLLTNLTNARSPMGRMVWIGEWKAPLTQDKFLASPKAQYAAFARSMRLYFDGLKDGSVAMPDEGAPDGLSVSGMLAVLHRCGPSGLRTWNDEDDRFPSTVALVERTNGIF